MQKLKRKIGVNPGLVRRWADFEDELVRHLQLLEKESHRYIMFVSTKSNRFVQFTSQENGKILSEAHCLPGDNQLTPAIRRQLVRVGWKPPDVFIPSRLSRTFKGNFWRIWPASGKTDGLVAFGVKTLRDIFAIRSPSELEVLSDMFANCPDPLIQQEPGGRSPVLKRTRTTYEFFVRYPCGTSAINGYRRAARHFKLHTLEDPCSQGNDDCRLLIHKNSRTLREAAKVLSDAGSITSSMDDDEEAMPILEDAENWLSENDVHWFHHDWKYWDIEQDSGALEALGWRRVVVETGKRYRVTIQKVRRGFKGAATD